MGVLTNTSFKNGYGSFWVTFWVFRDARRATLFSFVNWLVRRYVLRVVYHVAVTPSLNKQLSCDVRSASH